MNDVVIVGGGQAAMQTVDSLRREGFEGSITLVSEEPHLPYQRPPLSKKFLSGELDEERLFFRPEDFYTLRGVTLMLGTRIAEIDRIGTVVRTEDGRSVPYDALVLAVGARVRRLPVPGADLPGVHYLRTLDDSRSIAVELAGTKRVCVIGGGFIGLEVAAVCREMGKEVTVVETGDRLMARAVSPMISDYYRDYHTAQGVEILTGTTVTEIQGEARVEGVAFADGGARSAELVVVGIGIEPSTELATTVGIECDNGILVDDHCRSSDPRVFAIGDCSNHPNVYLGRRMRLESVQNAVDQARVAAANIAGRDMTYREVPWFWSDQYDLKLQMAGICSGYDDLVIRGSRSEHKFSVFYFSGNHLVAIDSINRPADHMAGRKLLAAGAEVSPEKAADESENLKNLIPSER